MAKMLYVHPDNPQARLLNQAVASLQQGGVVVYPTDSGYALGCALGNKSAIERIARIRQIEKDHHFALVCADLSQLATYARVDNQQFRLIKNNTPGAYTFIFKGTKEVPRRLLNDKKKTIGIRVPDNHIAQALVVAMGEPIMTSTLLLPGDDFAQSDPDEFQFTLEKHVDVIIHGGILPEQASTVVDLSEDDITLVRRGSGDPTPFES